MCKHCTKCDGFVWWDGDFCCVKQMAIIEHSPNGEFWCPFPQSTQKRFDANTCEEYVESENMKWYNAKYEEFIKKITKYNDTSLTINEYYEKYYPKEME